MKQCYTDVKSVTIELNQWEARIVKFMAKERFMLARSTDKHHVIYGIAKEENELNSFGAEFAFCKYMNCYPDLTPGQLLAYDAVINGATFDIKQTHRENGRLLVRTKNTEIIPPDYYILMVGIMPKFRIAGYIKGTEMLDKNNIMYNLPHPAYAKMQAELQEISLLTRIEKYI